MNLRIGVALPIMHTAVSLNKGDPIMIAASNPTATKITFEMEIPAGEHTLQGCFTDEQKQALRGAFFCESGKNMAYMISWFVTRPNAYGNNLYTLKAT